MMETKSGEDLLDQLNTATTLPEICFLVISMPGMGGVETLKPVWVFPQGRPVPKQVASLLTCNAQTFDRLLTFITHLEQ